MFILWCEAWICDFFCYSTRWEYFEPNTKLKVPLNSCNILLDSWIQIIIRTILLEYRSFDQKPFMRAQLLLILDRTNIFLNDMKTTSFSFLPWNFLIVKHSVRVQCTIYRNINQIATVCKISCHKSCTHTNIHFAQFQNNIQIDNELDIGRVVGRLL